jgi:hypothetical protein
VAPFTIPVIHAGLGQKDEGAVQDRLRGRIRWDSDGALNSTLVKTVGTTSTTKSRRIVETPKENDSCRMQFALMAGSAVPGTAPSTSAPL